MPIHNVKNPELTQLQNDIYITIKNTPALLETFFEQLFGVTQTYLGRSTRKQFNGIIADTYGYKMAKEKWAAEKIQAAINLGRVVITPEGKIDGKQTVTTFLSLAYCAPLLTDAIREYNELTDEYVSLYALSGESAPLFKALLEDYWDDMLAFGKLHTRYQKNWESIGYAARTAA